MHWGCIQSARARSGVGYRYWNTVALPSWYVRTEVTWKQLGSHYHLVGPIIGAFISQNLGWRWAYWIMVMATIPLNILMFFFMQESNHPTILEKKAARLRKELGRDDLHSQLEMKLPPRQVLARSLVRPIKVSQCSPDCPSY